MTNIKYSIFNIQLMRPNFSIMTSSSSPSFQLAAWKRLKKNKGAVVGMGVIGLSVIIALFAYFISPDPSPYANRIILEIGGEKPGYTRDFLKLGKEKEVKVAGFFNRLLNGQEDKYYYIPIVAHELRTDSI